MLSHENQQNKHVRCQMSNVHKHLNRIKTCSSVINSTVLHKHARSYKIISANRMSISSSFNITVQQFEKIWHTLHNERCYLQFVSINMITEIFNYRRPCSVIYGGCNALNTTQNGTNWFVAGYLEIPEININRFCCMNTCNGSASIFGLVVFIRFK